MRDDVEGPNERATAPNEKKNRGWSKGGQPPLNAVLHGLGVWNVARSTRLEGGTWREPWTGTLDQSISQFQNPVGGACTGPAGGAYGCCCRTDTD